MIETHRGIRTTTERINEENLVTIKNRFGQKSLSLPRIDDQKRWSGYPSLAGWSRKIVKFIPPCKYFVECFAGTVKVSQVLMKNNAPIENYIFNDKSQKIHEWLKKEFPTATNTNMDFVECVLKYDSKDTVILFDSPWVMSFYKQPFSCFDRNSVREYDEQILSLCTGKPMEKFNLEGYKIKGKFIITTRKENTRMKNSGFKNKLIKSEYVLSGHYPILLITSNLKNLRIT